MVNIACSFEGYKVALGDVSGVIRFVYQYMVPGGIFWRPGFSHCLVPFFGPRKYRIDIEHEPTILEQFVDHLLAYKEISMHRMIIQVAGICGLRGISFYVRLELPN